MFGKAEGRLPQTHKGEAHVALLAGDRQGHAEAWAGPQGLRAAGALGLPPLGALTVFSCLSSRLCSSSWSPGPWRDSHRV